MDLNQEVWDALRKQGHVLGTPYYQDGAGIMVVVDDVAMTIREARRLVRR